MSEQDALEKREQNEDRSFGRMGMENQFIFYGC